MNRLLKSIWASDRPWLTPEANAKQKAEMMAKQAAAGSAVAAKGLEVADHQIAMLKDRLLPYDPHIVTVPTIHPYHGGFDYEHKGTPFEEYEVKQLQYVTLVGETDRGTAKPWPAAEWVDTIEARSPASLVARSNTTTPNAANASKEAKIPKTKISIADYKNMKKTGVKSSPNPVGRNRPAHSRNVSAVSGGEPLSRDNSFEGVEGVRQNGGSFPSDKGAVKAVERSAVQATGLSTAKAHPPATTNGHTHTSDHSRHKEPTSHPQVSRHPPEHIKHGLPPRPPSPSRSTPTYNLPDSKQQKRPLESADATQPEKRSKIEHTRTPTNSQNNHSRTPSGSQNHLPRKPNTPSDPRPSPLKSQSQAYSSPQTKKTPVTKAPYKDTHKLPEKPLDLPPILSPLPADLGSSPASGFATLPKKPEPKKSAQGTPSKYGLGTDTIVVKKAPSPLKDLPQSSRAASEPAFELPPLLSPTLPDVVEQELLRLQQKSAALNNEAKLNSVEARHEKARRPDTPGVARKTTVVKVGHPPKKTHAESGKVHAEKTTLIVKLKYKKRKANFIQRILGIRAKPTHEYVRLEKARIAGQQKESRSQQDDESDDADEHVTKTAAKTPAPAPAPTPAPVSASKKRPSEAVVEPRSEPAAKRSKLPETIDVAKSKTSLEPAFKSPAISQPSQKNLLSTPKKGDAMKSVTMRKVNSSDGAHAHTPQTSTSTPTPASAEKPRPNGVVNNNVDSKKELGTYLKRKMDSILHLKDGKRDTVDETAKKLGLSVALECVAIYMVAFAASDRLAKRRQPKDWESVIQLWEFINGLAKNTVLQRLSFELGALCREELQRSYFEKLSEKLDSEVTKLMMANATKRDRCWYSAHHPPPPPSNPAVPNQPVMMEVKQLVLDKEKGLGSWSSMNEARDYVFEVLETFAKRERTGWKPTETVEKSEVRVRPSPPELGK